MNHQRTDSSRNHRSRLLAPAAIILATVIVLGVLYWILNPPSPASDTTTSNRTSISTPLDVTETVNQNIVTESGTQNSASIATDANAGSPASSAWLQTIQEDIQQKEYQVTWQENLEALETSAAYQAPNREQNFRTYFLEEGIRLQPRDVNTTRHTWEWGLSLASYGYEKQIPVADARLEIDGNRITYQRGPVAEWYINDTSGLEQGFTIQHPPNNFDQGTASPLILHLDVLGNLLPTLAEDKQQVDFYTAFGDHIIHYSDLYVFDATGQTLPAYMDLSSCHHDRPLPSCQVQLIIEDQQATYPLTIDPVASAPDWSAGGGQADAEFGFAVDGAGDVNGDGYDDIIVGAPMFDNGETNEGVIFIYFGSQAGLSSSVDWSVDSDQADAHFGYSVAAAGDINGDGYGDIVAGAPDYDTANQDAGRMILYYGGATGLTETNSTALEGNQDNVNFGFAVDGAGDVNGDGYDDLIVGAPDYYDNSDFFEGWVYIYYGSSSGLTSSNPWIAEGGSSWAHLGFAVSGVGDINGDSYDDVLLGAPDFSNGESSEGIAHLYPGSATGPATTPSWSLEGGLANADLGYAVDGAGDVNGDGYEDIIVGARRYENGRVYVFHGSASGVTSQQADWTAAGDQMAAFFGQSVAGPGDVDGDGYDDILIGVPHYDNDQLVEGRVYFYSGTSSGLKNESDWVAEGDQAYANFGVAIAGAGDINDDGFADILIGAHQYDGAGNAFSYYGSADGLNTIADWTAEGDQQGALMGYALDTAGDVNGDGYDDIIIGSPNFDNGESDEGRVFVYHGSINGLSLTTDWVAESNQADALFGRSVGTAGDVNGDGYDDILVGSAYSDGQTDGRVSVYFGSASGLPAAPDWEIQSDQANAAFGADVGMAGDVNNDGYDDILVGAYLYSNGQLGEGRVYLYYGSATGPTGTPWTAESDQANANFGIGLSTAGDVNGDDYADVIIGAYRYDSGRKNNEGWAYVYHGSSTGLSTTYSWQGSGDQSGAFFGFEVSTAGDVNNDGFDDVMVGAYQADNGESNEGVVYVFHGSGSGVTAPAAWTAEGDQAGAQLGYDISEAGDVNGDGYDDIIISAPEYDNGETGEGLVQLYHGSATGLNTLPDWSVESDQTGARLGLALSHAGDVNGDGYADILLGSPYYDYGQSNEGFVYVYYGSGAGATLPTADFSATPLTGTLPLTVTFTNLSTNFTSASWQFGDGVTSSVPNPTHVYTQTGTYTVTLQVTGPGGSDSEVKLGYITVEAAVPTADFSATPLTGTLPLTVTFTNLSTHFTSSSWQFGDDGTSSVPDPTHVYTQAGTYTVTLQVTGAGGVDTEMKANYITVETNTTASRNWQQVVTANSPTAVGEYGMAYDSNRDVVVLYGGNATGWPYESSTWEFDGTDWAEVTTSGQPNAVYGMSMVYDADNDVMFLFGGSDSTDAALAETWMFDATTDSWTQLTTPNAPPARTYAQIVYTGTGIDPEIYLFGGNDGTTYYNDVWRYDGSDWAQVSTNGTSPTARTHHAIAYDSTNDMILLFGGRDAIGTLLADTWQLDLITDTWSQGAFSGPSARMAHGLAYNAARAEFGMVGGTSDSGNAILNDTWHFDSSGWVQASPTQTAPDSAYDLLVYDSTTDALILYVNGETWEYK